jgi:cell volume regulation protein A
VLLTLGVLASLVASRVRVPGLVLFLGLGMLVGSGSWLLQFNDFDIAQSVGIVALSLILFEGGLAAGFPEIRPVLRPALLLALIGTVVTAVLTGLAASALFDFSFLEGQLLGAIVAGTDGAAIFALLRGSTLRRRLARTLEGESGMNDPVAILLVIGCIEWITTDDFGAADLALLVVEELAIGAAVGVMVGRIASRVLQSARLATGGLYPVATVATAALAFGLADVLTGSGFLAVYLAGLFMGSATFPAKQSTLAFHEGLAWVAQLTMFLVLGMLVVPGDLPGVAVGATALTLILVFLTRPIATVVATTGQGFSWRERLVLSWAGLRGAVPIVLATFPVIAGVGGGHEMFNIVFFVVLLSTLVQGASFETVARRLGTTTTEPALPNLLADQAAMRRLGAELLAFPVSQADAIVGLAVRELGLPRDAVVNVIVRDEQAIPPRGSTRVLPGDELHVLYREEASRELMGLANSWRSGHEGGRRRPRKNLRGAVTVFSVRPWDDADGTVTRPDQVQGIEVVEHLRLRRDAPGCLVVLSDGRYAVCGEVVAIGARRQIIRWLEIRQRNANAEERAWMRTIIGAVATDAAEQHS